MSVALTQTRVRPDDTGYDVMVIGANFGAGKVMVRVQFTNGDTQDIIFEGPRLTALRNAVSQFSGLRQAIEQYLAANESGLAGTAT